MAMSITMQYCNIFNRIELKRALMNGAEEFQYKTESDTD